MGPVSIKAYSLKALKRFKHFVVVSSVPIFTSRMSPSYYDPQLKKDTKKFSIIWTTQIYQCLLFFGVLSSRNLANGLESQDAIFVNFHRRYNVSKVAVLRNNGYLALTPVPDFSLPEVIDNKAQKVIGMTNDSGNYPNVLHLPEQDFLRTFAHKGAQDTRYSGSRLQTPHHQRRPTSPRGKRPPQITTQFPPFFTETPESLANRISIEEMSCQNAAGELFFRVSIKASKISVPPVVDNAMAETCQAMAVGESYRINFEKDQFWNCGVVDCSADGNKSYCLDLRFPVISGLRLKDDYKVTLRCKSQDRIGYRTKRINVKTLETKARNAPYVLNGGYRNIVDVDVGLFRKTYSSENIFDTRIQSGSTVVLGEEILLRVLIKGDDGWRYSKIGQVTAHYVETRQQRNVVNSLWILDKDGCLNTDVREICPREQYLASPLESYLIFQAFMFEDMTETDEIFLTVKAIACLEAVDCVLDCPAGHIRRTRRSTTGRNNTVEWQNDIALRVILPKYEVRDSHNYYLAISLSAIALFALVASLSFVKASLFRRTTKF